LTGPDGVNLNLSARAYHVLIYLLENRHRVVSKEELMKAVWPRSVVEENNLNQAVTILRRALGDRRDAAQFVRTVAGRGYRFVGDVIEEANGSGPEESRAPQPAGETPPAALPAEAERLPRATSERIEAARALPADERLPLDPSRTLLRAERCDQFRRCADRDLECLLGESLIRCKQRGDIDHDHRDALRSHLLRAS
jgi:DNA-binding winged helix-turn-helix (wHTH) protein